MTFYNRGREGQTKVFTAWKVLKVCSQKYIKNYLFFWTSYSIINNPQTLPWFRQLVAIFGNFFAIFLTSPTISVKLLLTENIICDTFRGCSVSIYSFFLWICFRKLNDSRRNCLYLGMMITLSSWWWPSLYVQRIHASILIW